MAMDLLFARLSQVLDALAHEAAARSPFEWAVFFAPLFLLEIPRYYLKIVGLSVAKLLGIPKRDEVQLRSFFLRRPFVTVIVAGRNEAASIAPCLNSLLAQDYPHFEVLVIDDDSDDGMYEIARAFRHDRRVRVVKNSSPRGRLGKPGAVNLGLRLAHGEFVISLDADTTFATSMVREMMAPFARPEVGIVAGNVTIRNRTRNWITRVQTLEYAIGIELHKRWRELRGTALHASGAIAALRREAVGNLDGWDQEMAEDADVSLRIMQSGWKLAFASKALAQTDAPETLAALIRQRTRWDRGGWQVFLRKHRRLLRPSLGGRDLAIELGCELFFFIGLTLVYPIYILWLLSCGGLIFGFVFLVSLVLNTFLSLFCLAGVAFLAESVKRPWALLPSAFVMPFYKGLLRWARLRALVLEFLRIEYEDPFLPRSAWVHGSRH